jgi:hypothetical protein
MKPVFTRQIYLSGQDSLNLINRCDKILERENWSFNKLVEEALKEYEVRHGFGNNSFQLDTFGITWTKAKAVSKCGFKSCDKLAIGVGLFVPKKQTVGLCKEHFLLAQGNPKIWADLKYPLDSFAKPKGDECSSDV